MAKKKIHIDELFRKGLSNLSLFVSNKDLEAIDEKKSVFNEENISSPGSAFSDFEMEVSDADWLATKTKLDTEKSAMSGKGVFYEAFRDFAIEPEPDDWKTVLRRYRFKKAIYRYRWLGTGIFLFLVGLTVFLFSLPARENQKIRLASEPSNTITSGSKIGGTTSETTSSAGSAETEDPAEQLRVSKLDVSEKETGYVKTGSEVKPGGNAFSRTSNPGLNTNTIGLLTAGSSGKPMPETLPSERGLTLTSSGLLTAPVLNPQALEAKPAETPSDAKPTEQNPEPAPAELPEIAVNAKDTPIKKDETTPKPAGSVVKPYTLYLGAVNSVQSEFRRLGKDNNGFYNAIRNNGEQPEWSWTKGLEAGIMTGKNMFSVGLLHNAHSINTHYKYKYRIFDSIPVRNPQQQIIGYFLFNGRDTLIDKKSQNRSSSIQLPLAYKRLFKINSRLQLLAGAAATFSFLTGSSGDYILSPDNRQLYPYSSFSAQERRFNISPAFDLGAQFSLSTHLELQAGFGGSTALYSRFKTSFGAAEHPYNLGINIKLLYKLL